MGIKVQPGRWKTRGNDVATVTHSMRRDPGEFALRFVWVGFIAGFAEYWDDDGMCRPFSCSLNDLTEYLGHAR